MSEERQDKEKKKKEERPRLLSWDNMPEDKRALYVGVMIARRRGLWNSFPDFLRVGLAGRIAELELGEMEDAGFGEIAKELRDLSTKDGLKPLFKKYVAEKGKEWSSSAEGSTDLPRRR